MEKYSIATFKSVLNDELSAEEARTLFLDPVFEKEFTFYLQFKAAGQQLIDKYPYVLIGNAPEPNFIPLRPHWWVIAASVLLVLSGGFLLFPSDDIMMGNQPTFLEQYGVGLGLILTGVGLFFWFRKR